MLSKKFITLDKVREVDELLQNEFSIDHFDTVDAFFDRFKPLKKRIDEYFKLHDRIARRVEKGGSLDESLIMKKLADFGLNGAIGSMFRRHFYIDAICFISSVLDSENIEGKVIDIGCHNGVIPLILSYLHSNKFIGCDPCYPAISSAKRHKLFQDSVEFLDCELPQINLPPGDLIYCLDVLHHMPDTQIGNSFRRLCHLVDDNGFLILTTSLFHEDEWVDAFNKILEEERVGFVACDVIGGYGKCPPEFEASIICIFKKNNVNPIPRNLSELADQDWNNYFKAYANNPAVATREKTQSFERALRLL